MKKNQIKIVVNIVIVCFDRNFNSLFGLTHCVPFFFFQPDDILLYCLTSESISSHCRTGTSSHDSQQPEENSAFFSWQQENMLI